MKDDESICWGNRVPQYHEASMKKQMEQARACYLESCLHMIQQCEIDVNSWHGWNWIRIIFASIIFISYLLLTVLVGIELLRFYWLRTLLLDSQKLLQSLVHTLQGIPMKPEISEECFDNQWTAGSNFTQSLRLLLVCNKAITSPKPTAVVPAGVRRCENRSEGEATWKRSNTNRTAYDISRWLIEVLVLWNWFAYTPWIYCRILASLQRKWLSMEPYVGRRSYPMRHLRGFCKIQCGRRKGYLHFFQFTTLEPESG